MKKIVLTLASFLLAAGAAFAIQDSGSAIEALEKGNLEYVNGSYLKTSKKAERQVRLKNSQDGQHPVAAILSCSDSRVPLERIFNQGLGDIFVIRTAGNAAGLSETASIEYAVHHLHVPLVVVLGHTSCGAISASVNNAKEEGALGILIESLEPVAELTKDVPAQERLAKTTKLSVEKSVKKLKENTTISKAMREGKVTVVGAIYDIETGKVEFL